MDLYEAKNSHRRCTNYLLAASTNAYDYYYYCSEAKKTGSYIETPKKVFGVQNANNIYIEREGNLTITYI